MLFVIFLYGARSASLEHRLTLAVLTVGLYWAAAVFANTRIATVTPQSVTIRLRPFPTGSDQHIPRGQIGRVYVRRDVETTDSEIICRDDFSIGIETLAGQQLTMKERYSTEAEARIDAAELAELLDLRPEAELVEANPTYPTLKRQIALWTLITLAALILAL